ncbi:MAG: AbiEi antitoxin N-terminal domain-containing protein [Planctomycetia bacterium]
MGISGESKLKSLVHSLPRHGVVTRSSLAALGVTPQHTQKYVASGWLESVGVGVFKRPGDVPTWQGGLHALQTQDGLAVHVGGLTALAAEGAQTRYDRVSSRFGRRAGSRNVAQNIP